ncbi:putative polyprotein [Tanacetum coccineum]
MCKDAALAKNEQKNAHGDKRPLYEQKNAHGDKRLKPSDYELVKKIKEQVQNLLNLEIPPENAYIILETDGCMKGWGGIVKWKKSKEDLRSSERICAYASGKFSTTQSTIDAEINACINTLEKLKIYYLDKQILYAKSICLLAFVENLLGESEKLMWQQWRTAYPGAYSALKAILDEPQNITSQVRQLILLEDPYRGSTDEQDRAYRELDRITCGTGGFYN